MNTNLDTAQQWTKDNPIGTVVRARRRNKVSKVSSHAFNPPLDITPVVLLDTGEAVRIDQVERIEPNSISSP
jgi:hypothetical protein